MKRALRWVAIFFATLLGLFVLLALAMRLTPYPAIDAAPGRAIPGVFHVHAEVSHDGHGTLDEATRAAAEAGARFLVLTEHNVLRPDGPLVQNGVLVIPGVEISSKPGHVIAVGLAEVPPKEERGPQVLEAIAARGGAAVLAHPVNVRRPWSDPSPDGFAGFEVLSLDSAFRTAKAEKPWLLGLAAGALVGHPPKTGAILMERPADAFARYDEIAKARDLTLLCGVDAHGLPPYPASFGALRLFVPAARWTGDAQADAAAIVAAIREGDTFCSVPALGDASSFSFVLGDEAVARVAAEGVTLTIFRDGVEVARGPGPELRVPAGTGVWRAEVAVDDPGFPFRDGALWIASSARRAHTG